MFSLFALTQSVLVVEKVLSSKNTNTCTRLLREIHHLTLFTKQENFGVHDSLLC